MSPKILFPIKATFIGTGEDFNLFWGEIQFNIQQPVFVLHSAQDSLPFRVDCLVVNCVKPVQRTESYICPPPALSVPHAGLDAHWLRNVYEWMSLLFLIPYVKDSPYLCPPTADVRNDVLLGSERGKASTEGRCQTQRSRRGWCWWMSMLTFWPVRPKYLLLDSRLV